MNKIVIFISSVAVIVLVNLGMSVKVQLDSLKRAELQLRLQDLEIRQHIRDKEHLTKRSPVLLSSEYGLVMNQVGSLENYSGTNMDVELEGAKDTDDVSEHYVDTEYSGVKGLRIQIVVDKFSKETDMGAVLDDINLLEKNTDFMVSDISKDNNNLIIKGEIYGL